MIFVPGKCLICSKEFIVDVDEDKCFSCYLDKHMKSEQGTMGYKKRFSFRCKYFAWWMLLTWPLFAFLYFNYSFLLATFLILMFCYGLNITSIHRLLVRLF